MTTSIIKHDRVRLDVAGAACNEPNGTAPTAQARQRVPKGVRLLERDGRVHSIELTCACVFGSQWEYAVHTLFSE
jgi:hypothetical protein